MRWGAVEIVAKQALQLPSRKLHLFGDRRTGERRAEVALHRRDSSKQLGMRNAEPGPQLGALTVMLIADRTVNELFGNRDGKFMPMLGFDHIEHHVERGGPARTG